MKLVIDIPGNDYWLACNHPDALISVYAHYIKKGIPLPEKHGRLVDADALIAKCGDWYTEEGKEEGFIGTLEMLLKNVPTVVEAEGEMDYHSHLSPEQVRVLKPLVEENENAIEEFKMVAFQMNDLVEKWKERQQ